mmetsp:Transcript_10954/g.33600  ORF Transcript_10954/g.33600 Transcript_10954/m.33600 type:complete len:100 (+) Transcript_10954:33-332(+)
MRLLNKGLERSTTCLWGAVELGDRVLAGLSAADVAERQGGRSAGGRGSKEGFEGPVAGCHRRTAEFRRRRNVGGDDSGEGPGLRIPGQEENTATKPAKV